MLFQPCAFTCHIQLDPFPYMVIGTNKTQTKPILVKLVFQIRKLKQINTTILNWLAQLIYMGIWTNKYKQSQKWWAFLIYYIYDGDYISNQNWSPYLAYGKITWSFCILHLNHHHHSKFRVFCCISGLLSSFLGLQTSNKCHHNQVTILHYLVLFAYII